MKRCECHSHGHSRQGKALLRPLRYPDAQREEPPPIGIVFRVEEHAEQGHWFERVRPCPIEEVETQRRRQLHQPPTEPRIYPTSEPVQHLHKHVCVRKVEATTHITSISIEQVRSIPAIRRVVLHSNFLGLRDNLTPTLGNLSLSSLLLSCPLNPYSTPLHSNISKHPLHISSSFPSLTPFRFNTHQTLKLQQPTEAHSHRTTPPRSQ